MSNIMEHGYTYNDVLIQPRYSEIGTRSKVDLSTKIGNHCFELPVISANMKDITGYKMASEIGNHNGLALLHRFFSIEQSVKEFLDAQRTLKLTNKKNNVGVSIGVQENDKQRFESLYEAGARIFCIDVAHGHHLHVKKMLKWVNFQAFGCTIIAGNIATPEAYNDMCEWGADAVKVGIGPSPVCRTRYNTGAGVPQLFALERVWGESMNHKKPISIIADGGISHVGDIAKALKYSDAVMLGSMIAGTSETPGNVFRNEEGEFYKVYGGSASGENKGENRFVEGAIKLVKFKGKVKFILREIEHGLQSSFSYVGANNLKEFQNNCEFVYLSGGSRGESKI
jgi:IMP dehydrogenase/GMP reductase